MKNPGISLVLFNMKQMYSGLKDHAEWRCFYPWWTAMDRKWPGVTQKLKRRQFKGNLLITRQRISCSSLINPQNGMSRYKHLFLISMAGWIKLVLRTFNSLTNMMTIRFICNLEGSAKSSLIWTVLFHSVYFRPTEYLLAALTLSLRVNDTYIQCYSTCFQMMI